MYTLENTPPRTERFVLLEVLTLVNSIHSRSMKKNDQSSYLNKSFKTHSQMLGKFEYTRGPIFKVVLEC